MELEALQTPVETAAELKARILEGRKKHIGYNCALNYSKDPLMIVRGEGQWLYDEVGDREFRGERPACSQLPIARARKRQRSVLTSCTTVIHAVAVTMLP